jgi:hypothetical protein
MPPLLPTSALAPYDGRSSSASFPASESYYTDEGRPATKTHRGIRRIFLTNEVAQKSPSYAILLPQLRKASTFFPRASASRRMRSSVPTIRCYPNMALIPTRTTTYPDWSSEWAASVAMVRCRISFAPCSLEWALYSRLRIKLPP